MKLISRKKIPKEWERMKIVSTHKKGEKEKMRNKRGLFLIENVSKIHEKVIKNRNRRNSEREYQILIQGDKEKIND